MAQTNSIMQDSTLYIDDLLGKLMLLLFVGEPFSWQWFGGLVAGSIILFVVRVFLEAFAERNLHKFFKTLKHKIFPARKRK